MAGQLVLDCFLDCFPVCMGWKQSQKAAYPAFWDENMSYELIVGRLPTGWLKGESYYTWLVVVCFLVAILAPKLSLFNYVDMCI